MNQHHDIETSFLLEMLAQQTQQLTSMLMTTINSKEYEDCKKMIEELQREIAFRKNQLDNSRVTPPGIPSQTNPTI